MLKEFQTHIQNNFPRLTKDKFLLACSGGLDSVVLTHLCAALKFDFELAHCNFQLREEESDADEQFVIDLAEKLKIKLHVTHFNTNNYILKNKVNIQVAARELRYEWFAKLMETNDLRSLLTAHHLNDNLETFLINLSRGTGIDGLSGIPEKTDTISRPLLAFSRAQILNYAQVKNLKWVEDRSNADVKYLRNKIRHEIVPMLKELHPTFLENFKMTNAHLMGTSQILENHISLLKSKVFEETDYGYRIAIAELSILRPQPAYIHALFNAYGFTAWDDILRLLQGLSGKEVQSKTHRLVRNRGHLLLEPLGDKTKTSYVIEENAEAIQHPIALHMEVVCEIQESGLNILYVAKEALNYPLTVRKWEKGDYFYPLGMQGKKKLSKFFKDEKIDVISKDRQWLLYSGDDLVWVIGRRADRRFQVTEKTKSIVKFKVHS